MACSKSSSSIESVFEGFELCEASNVLLMTLMEETQEDDHYQNFEDERLVSMIQSLEAEISRNPMLMEQMDGQDCSASSSVTDDYDWVMDMEAVPSISSPFDDDLNAGSPYCADMNEDYYSDQFYCEVSWVASGDAEL
ncbi:uncharacterized protein LOC114714773 [Neltuma alba]|uniref:uncharacterized protein LOC114714773 n=1 Tax=Neltuma alba TaxID=207710 RepID=UPI0010A58967|nr:uncharacterized protein LOC114714773 [Prosopis alba]